MEEQKESSFTVSDRRVSAGQRQAESGTEPPRQKPADREERGTDQASTLPPEVDFSSFIISLATTVQVSLGNVPTPEKQTVSVNLPAAKQFIDIIAMLKEKTKGNLTDHERELIENVLFTLRMQYVKAAEGGKGPS